MSRRVLIVAAADLAGPEVRSAVVDRLRDAREVRVVAPALTRNVVERAMGDVDDAIAEAQGRLDRALEELGDPGVVTTGAVGDSDLRLAIQDALQTFAADEIVIVAHKDDPPAHEHEEISEAEKSFEPPIVELYVGDGESGAPRVADVERVGPGKQEVDPGEIETRSRNLPPFSPRDLAGILIAIVGTGALVVLAASCGEIAYEGFNSCAARVLLAGAFALINLAHIVGLTLFQSGPYRGFWRSFFADISLYGTPAAVAVSAILLR
ncbi:MAG TPA: hypothetical protein VK919_09545 [Solirubrobacterales bacterium]|nr:hypothetical protein [Solirubrobacterales bacterium]